MAHDMGAGIAGGISLDDDARDRLYERWHLTPGALASLTEAMAAEIEKAKVFLEIAARR
jgi:hypothetical protein